ncbi:hypothetical protein B296_00025892, partial [Ensete ventricosum]
MRLTGIGGGDDGAAGEVAVELVLPGRLVEGVHGVCGVGVQGVGRQARPAVLDRLAVHLPAAAHVVYVRLKSRVAS